SIIIFKKIPLCFFLSLFTSSSELTCASCLVSFVLGGDDRHATSGSVTRASRFLTGLLTHALPGFAPPRSPGHRAHSLLRLSRPVPRQPTEELGRSRLHSLALERDAPGRPLCGDGGAGPVRVRPPQLDPRPGIGPALIGNGLHRGASVWAVVMRLRFMVCCELARE